MALTARKIEMANRCWKQQHSNVNHMGWLGSALLFRQRCHTSVGESSKRIFQIHLAQSKLPAVSEQFEKSRKTIDICANCSEGVSVWKD
jgi:hypothetical protein